MDKQLFSQAVIKARDAQIERVQGGIGTLGEKTLHAVLKHYFEPDSSCHEIRIGKFVADIAAGDRIVEIQTRQFEKLRDKLSCFLDNNKVTIVYPVARTKWLIWLDEATGEATKKRKSPKTGTPCEAFFELYKIKTQLCHPNLTLCVVMLDLEEYRCLNGWNDTRKRGSTRYERIPVDIAEELYIRSPKDFIKLIPGTLEPSFTAKTFKKASGLSLQASRTALHVLHSVGAVTRTGKRGNAYVYEITAAPTPLSR